MQTHQDVQTSAANTVVLAAYQLKISFRDFWAAFLGVAADYVNFGRSPALTNGAKRVQNFEFFWYVVGGCRMAS